MPNTKTANFFQQTGATIYAVIRRVSDGFLIDDADGSFSASPADDFLAVPEDSVIKGFYELSESRGVWDDGEYEFFFYRQLGGVPDTESDPPVHETTIHISGDEIVDDSSVAASGASFDSALRNAGILMKAILDKIQNRKEILKKIQANQQDHELKLRRLQAATT